jgi:N-acyl-L-homoserine lactone synthetase
LIASLFKKIEVIEEQEAPTPNVAVRWFASNESKRELLSLRHEAYHRAGLIKESPWGIFADTYDEIPTTITAGLFRGEHCLSTLRLSYFTAGSDGPSLPCEKVYPEIAAIKAGAQGTIVELSRLAMDPTITNTRYRARLYAATIRAALLACLAGDAKQLLVATQMKWRKFYEHVLGFEVVAPPQFYPPGDVPVVLLSRPVDRALEQRIKKNAFFKTGEEELTEVRAQIAPLLGGGSN